VIPWIATAALGLLSATGFLWLRWRLQRAEDLVVLLRTEAGRREAAVHELEASMRDEGARHGAALRVLRAERASLAEQLAAMARAHPELAHEYLRDSLRAVADTSADPGPHPALSGGTAPKAPGGGGGRAR
jgi:hypothetical protein